jgi:glycosyltransferase involved in cell wall biosynthesis
MKKICIICPSLYPHLASRKLATDGGAEVQLKVLGEAFLKQGCDIHFIVGDYGQPEKEIVDEATIHKIPFRYRGGSNFYIFETWFELLKKLFKLQPDILLIKFPRDLLLPLGFFCKIMRKKTIFIGQIDNDVNPDYLKKENLFSYYIFRIGLKLTNLIVAQNRNQQQGFMQHYHRKSIMIANLLTLPLSKKQTEKSFILWVGNTLPKKRPELFIQLARIFPKYRFKMILAPTGSVPDDATIKKKAEEIDNLDYIGYVPFAEISEYFKGACLLVNTSEKEGFPNTFLQSWQYETPVVSLHVDPDKIIEKYQAGKISLNFDKLCEDVNTLMQDKKIRIKMGKNAKAYVTQNHSPEVIVPQYLKIIQE